MESPYLNTTRRALASADEDVITVSLASDSEEPFFLLAEGTDGLVLEVESLEDRLADVLGELACPPRSARPVYAVAPIAIGDLREGGRVLAELLLGMTYNRSSSASTPAASSPTSRTSFFVDSDPSTTTSARFMAPLREQYS